MRCDARRCARGASAHVRQYSRGVFIAGVITTRMLCYARRLFLQFFFDLYCFFYFCIACGASKYIPADRAIRRYVRYNRYVRTT